MKRGARRGCVRLRDAIIGIDDEEDSTFTITVDQKIFHFQSRDPEERKQWACSLEDTILRHSHRQVETVCNNSLDEFDRRLAEADVYLQILLESIKGVEIKFSDFESLSEKQNMDGVVITAQEMVEAVKRSIVLLQIAKTAVAENINSNLFASPFRSLSNNRLNNNKSVCGSLDLHKGIGIIENTSLAVVSGQSDTENLYVNDPQRLPTQKAQSILLLGAQKTSRPQKEVNILEEFPIRSYSSSEDESEFYDAQDLRSNKNIKNKSSEDISANHPHPMNRSEMVCTQEESLTMYKFQNQDSGQLPEEEAILYMQEEDANNPNEGESVEEHKSVIMHLLSQVKLGMDLTKVVLPTFILERRSLLEMYAAFFAHPDLFVQIADATTPETRMMTVIKFYLSTFSAGRDSSVAKKPYNPILGETFYCFYETSSNSGPAEVVKDGPLSWAKSNQLSFVAEQVSHHPPISAFYAEHKQRKIQFNGHIWTKSKFLGLSIGVHNIGQACLRLVEHDEEYLLNFPNGYGRSILTIPWVELGGDCTITCEKTGYNAFVKFHTKPFYGGKVHRLTSEVFAPNSKKPFCTIDGEWNGQMYAVHNSGRNECIFDAKNKKKSRKYVKVIENQEPNESRCLWKRVTDSLKVNDIEFATLEKRKLEEKQRQDAKQRQETGTIYSPKLFHVDDCQNWIFNNQLMERLATQNL